MLNEPNYITSEFISIGGHSTLLVVRHCGDIYVATWQCSCGACSRMMISSQLARAAIEAESRDYRKHCADVHP